MTPRPAARRLLGALLLGLAALSAACEKTQGPAPPDAGPAGPRTCSGNADCAAGWVCLAGKCADMRAGAVYLRPTEAVTPDKVKRQVDQIQERHQAGVDKAMQNPE